MNELIDLFVSVISNVGFPIAVVLLMFYQQNTTLKQQTESHNNLVIAINDLITVVKTLNG